MSLLEEIIALEEKNGNPATNAEPREYVPSLITATDLYARNLGEIRWAVKGLIPEGCTILAGKPKMGKSWLALNLAIAVAHGQTVLGQIPCEQGPVVYLALEDGPRRLQSRIKKLLDPTRTPPPPDLLLTCQWARSAEGGLAALATVMRERRPRLIIIDTLARIRTKNNGQSGLYAEDYDSIAEIGSLALAEEVAVVVVTHVRKTSKEDSEAADPLEEVTGTLGLTGAADCVLVLKRPRMMDHGSLFVTGRDLEERTLKIHWDPRYGIWEMDGEQQEGPQLTALQKAIIAVLEGRSSGMKPLEIMAALGSRCDGKPYDAVRKTIQRMEAEGLIGREGHGQYVAILVPTVPSVPMGENAEENHIDQAMLWN